MFRSITSRLVFLYCLLLAMLGALFLAFTMLSFNYYTRETLGTILSNRAKDVWNLSRELQDRPQRLGEIIERSYSPKTQNRFIRVHVGNDILYRSGPPVDGGFDPEHVPLTASVGGNDAPKAVLLGNLLLYSRSFKNSAGQIVTVDTGQSYTFARGVQVRLAQSLFIALPILLALAALAGYVLMRRALVPVEAMIKAAETYTFNQPHKRIPTEGAEPRIQALGLALNRMLDRLDTAYSHASRFSADAAHELRTPLTIIRGELELVASDKRFPPDVGQAISNALEEITRMSEMVDGLITLTRMESIWGKLSHSAVDLAVLAEETIDQMNLLAEEKSIALRHAKGAPSIVAGDRNRLKQVLVNLIDNAIKYTPAHGQVVVETGIEGEMGFVAVKDTGIGIDPAHHDRIFDRFYRVSTDRGEVGAGLGLAIVRSICHAHGGSISLQSGLRTGSCFTVRIPPLPAAS